ANYGLRGELRVDGVPVGRMIGPDSVPLPWPQPVTSSSIIVIIATDAPLLPIQCRRLAQRATTGLARVGGYGHNSSGDIFLAFSTGNHLPVGSTGLYTLHMLHHEQIDPLFYAVAEATEEAILNALCAAETITGFQNRISYAIPHDLLGELMAGRKV
ncbi:MAG: S58 family peptidase, partial [Oscillochloris sp.]|nr:S58 family peptidase [Oscillochloris sp.]